MSWRSSRRRDSGAPISSRSPVHQAHPSRRRDHLCPRRVLEYEIEGQAPKTFSAGEALTVPAGAVHAVRNIGTGNAAELATYVVEKGKPLLTLVQ
jgi:hypothetical protein